MTTNDIALIPVTTGDVVLVLDVINGSDAAMVIGRVRQHPAAAKG